MVSVISHVDPDVLLLTGFDYDLDAQALIALNTAIGRQGAPYGFFFAKRPNTGFATGLDLDGDGQLGGPGDAQGYGRFAGEGGMAILSRLPVEAEAVQDFPAFCGRICQGL